MSLEVRENEFLLIVGASGSGKSTLIRSFNGLIPHFYGGEVGGRVTVDGLDTRRTPPAKMASIVGWSSRTPRTSWS